MARLNNFAAFGMIPIGDVIFGKKGVVTEIATNHEANNAIKEKVSDSLNDIADKSTSFFHFPSISEWLGFKDKIGEIADEMHQRALLTPDPNDDKVNFLLEMYAQADKSIVTHFMPMWFKEIIIYITAVMGEVTHNATQTLLQWIYNIVSSIVLWTPEFLFENDWFASTTGKFSVLSVGVVILFTMIEGLKKILNMNHTPFREILKKLPISLGVSAATPFLFTNGVHLLNKLTHIIMNIGKDEIGSNQLVGILNTAGLAFEPVNILMMLLFSILFLILCVPMTFFHAKRWFDLLCAGILTPFGMSCWMFRNTQHLFRYWLSMVKDAGLKQLVYAVFITILGLILFATPNPTTLGGMFSKLLISLGALYRLAFPPSFVRNLSSGSDNKSIADLIREVKGKKNDLVRTKDKAKETSEDTLVKAAALAGKAYRKFFK